MALPQYQAPPSHMTIFCKTRDFDDGDALNEDYIRQPVHDLLALLRWGTVFPTSFMENSG